MSTAPKRPDRVAFTLLGNLASKANSRRVVVLPNKAQPGKYRGAVIKSESALEFEENALKQIPPAARLRIASKVCVHVRVHYRSEQSDLDESLLLDVLQDRWKLIRDAGGTIIGRVLIQRGVYTNDRLVRERHAYHAIDKDNPRVEVIVEPLKGTVFVFAQEQMDLDLVQPLPKDFRLDDYDEADVAF